MCFDDCKINHVLPYQKDGKRYWVVTPHMSDNIPDKFLKTQKEAIDEAKKIEKDTGTIFLLHNLKGEVRKRYYRKQQSYARR